MTSSLKTYNCKNIIIIIISYQKKKKTIIIFSDEYFSSLILPYSDERIFVTNTVHGNTYSDEIFRHSKFQLLATKYFVIID